MTFATVDLAEGIAASKERRAPTVHRSLGRPRANEAPGHLRPVIRLPLANVRTVGHGGSVGKTVRTDRGCASTAVPAAPVDDAGDGVGTAGVLLWTSVVRAVDDRCGWTRHAEVTCGDVVHRLCTVTTLVVPRATVGAVSDSQPSAATATGAGRDGPQHPPAPHRVGPPGGGPDRGVGAGPDQPGRGVALGGADGRAGAGERAQAAAERRATCSTASGESVPALSRRPGGPTSVRWVDNMNARWGSCTPVDGTIRLSRRLVGMPGYVIDYVLLHELAHLIEPGHGPAFRAGLAGYERLERAEGFLEGVELVRQAVTDRSAET